MVMIKHELVLEKYLRDADVQKLIDRQPPLQYNVVI